MGANQMEEKNALIINGSGTAGGGTFDKVRINGSGKIVGDLVCDSFAISGSGKVQGMMKVGDAHISGSGTLTGEVEADTLTISGSGHLHSTVHGGTLRISGSGRVDGGVSMREVRIEGSSRIGGDCEAEDMRVDGVAQIGGNCTCERFRVHGGIIVDGLLNADDIQIDLYHTKSRAKEIGGGHIDVRVALVGAVTAFIRTFFLGKDSVLLETDSIEGDDIYLERTHAGVVRGRDITLGKGCDIDLVEYTGTLTKLDDATVREEHKL